MRGQKSHNSLRLNFGNELRRSMTCCLGKKRQKCSRRTIDCDTETFSRFKKVSYWCTVDFMSFRQKRAEFWVLSKLQGFRIEQHG